jgi:hypothetical protein
MRRVNVKIHTTHNNIIMAEIDNFLLTHPTWPEPRAKKLENIRRMFDRRSKQDIRLDELEIEIRPGDYKRTSVISERLSGQTDESFHNVFGLIHDPSADSANDEERRSRSNWQDERKSRSNWLGRTN